MKTNCFTASLFILGILSICSACSTSGSEYHPDGDWENEGVSVDGDFDGGDGDMINGSEYDSEPSFEEYEEDQEFAQEIDFADEDTESSELEYFEDVEDETASDGDNISNDGDFSTDGDETEEDSLEGEILPCQPLSASTNVFLLKGTVVTPTEAWLNGEVLTDRISGQILCASEDCSEHAKYEEASIICADGIIMPAMLDPHNHSGYNTIPRWKHGGDGYCWQNGTNCKRLNGMYRTRYQWADDPEYDNTLKIHYNSLKTDHHCAMQKWAEIRMMMHGTSGVAGSYNTSICHCHLDGKLMMVRNLDQPRTCSGLDSDTMRSSISSPCDLKWDSYYSGVCDAFSSGSANVIFLHVAEGVVAAKSQNEFYCLLDPNPNDAAKTFMLEQIIGIHSTAAFSNEAKLMACTGMQTDARDTYKIVWSPRSNIDLYGQTTNIPLALNMGVSVAIGPDWTPSGSLSQLQEMRCARYVSRRYWNDLLDDRTLLRYTTDLAARVMKIDHRLGKLEAGYLADITIIAADESGRRRPYRSVLNAEAWNVRLLLIGGKPMYGDINIAPFDAFCENLDVCGHSKTICVKMSDNPADAEKGFTQTLTDIHDELSAALQPLKNAAAEKDKYIFELMPLFYCPGTAEYQADQPEEVCTFKHNPHSDVLFPAIPKEPIDNDDDEDGVPNDIDNCPHINNADQMDRNENGVGDACETIVLNSPPSNDCPCSTSICNRTECLSDVRPQHFDQRWTSQASYPERNPQDYAVLVEIGDIRNPYSKFSVENGETILITGAVITFVQENGYYICDPSGKRRSAILVEDFEQNEIIETGNEIDIVGEIVERGENILIRRNFVTVADSHRIEAEAELLPLISPSGDDKPDDFVGMNIRVPLKWRARTSGPASGVLATNGDGTYLVVPLTYSDVHKH